MTERRPVPILFVHHRRELGGAPESLANLVRGLDRSRFEPHVFVPEGPAADLFRAAGATVHTGTVAAFTHIWASTYHSLRWLLLVRELGRLPSHAWAFRRTLRAVRPAIVHVNDSPALAAVWLARRARVPVVLHLRSALPERAGARTRFMRTAVARLPSISMAINEDVAASFAAGSLVVPNSVDLERFKPGDSERARAAVGVPHGRPVVASFGFIYPSKGFRELIAAAALVRERGIEATYLLVGGNVRPAGYFLTPHGRALTVLGLAQDYEADARQLALRLGLADVVRILPYRDVTEVYRASDVVVAPSQGPEIGRSIVEAAASGVPVIASGSRTGGGIILPGRTGILTQDRSAGAIADALVELLGDAARRRELGLAARAHAESHFALDRNTSAVEETYLALLGRS